MSRRLSTLFLLALLGACGGEHAPAPPVKFQVGEDGNDVDNNPVLTSSFESIKTVVFERSCFSCHATGGRAANVPLENYAD